MIAPSIKVCQENDYLQKIQINTLGNFELLTLATVLLRCMVWLSISVNSAPRQFVGK